MDKDPKIIAARAFVRGLNILLKSIRLYGPEHERVAAQSATAWDQFRATLAGAGNAPFVLGVSGSQLLLDGTPLGDTPVERGFANLLVSAGLNSIQFAGRATQGEFNRFVRAFAAAGPKGKNLAEQLKAALGQGSQAGIRINEVRFVPEDSALADARTSAQIAVSALGVSTDQMQPLLDDPGKLLQFIAATEAAQTGATIPQAKTPAAEAGGNKADVSAPAGGTSASQTQAQPLQEEELTSVLRLLADIGRASRRPGTPGIAGQMKEQFSSLPGAAQTTLQEALAALSKAAPPTQPDAPMLLRLAEHLALRHALDRYDRGDVEVNAVREMLDRMSSEIMTLRKLLRDDAGKQGEPAEVTKSDLGDLEDQFWTAMPAESMRHVLQSTRAWCVPPRQVRGLVEDLLSQGDSELSTAVLVNYAACIENPNSEARHRATRGLSLLADVYVGGYSEILGAAIHHLCEQLSRESSPDLQKLLTETFLDLIDEAAATTSSSLYNVSLTCLSCREQRLSVPGREELVEILSMRDVQLYCPQCESATLWSAEKPDEQREEELPAGTAPAEGDKGKRRAARARMELQVRIRSDAPELTFTEVNSTVNISRTGALFRCSHPLRRGMEVFVQVPYKEGDDLPDTRAKVVRVHVLEDQYEVAVHFLR